MDAGSDGFIRRSDEGREKRTTDSSFLYHFWKKNGNYQLFLFLLQKSDENNLNMDEDDQYVNCAIIFKRVTAKLITGTITESEDRVAQIPVVERLGKMANDLGSLSGQMRYRKNKIGR